MKVAFYNQMFGLNGRKFRNYIRGHAYLHYLGKKSLFVKLVDLRRTFKLIKETEADIIGFCEVLDFQKKEMEEGLNKLGYPYIFFGKGHLCKAGWHVNVVLASKIKCKQIETNEFPAENYIGGGGGIVHAYFPERKWDVVIVHLWLPRKKVYAIQLKFVKSYLGNVKGKLILMGDFNLSYNHLKKHFCSLNLISGAQKTCKIPLIGYKDFDHIFARGFKKYKSGCAEGNSDHKLVWVGLE
ncbi:MAG: endonuclease/exonuclease/phosphatase family protein [Nanoarchaeota archaeon]|nr:endonuclease/exonuclease/phosphatase family protein [Nanoarchaeota archaeon]